MSEQDDTIAEFVAESREHLDRLDQDFVALENSPQARPLLARIFRTIHTIKGSSGLLGFASLERLTHAGENLLSRLRDGKILLTSERVTILLRMVDVVRALLERVESSGTDGTDDHGELIAGLERLLAASDADSAPAATDAASAMPAAPASGAVAVAAAAAPPPSATGQDKAPEAAAAGRTLEHTVRVSVNLLDRLMNLAGETILVRNQLVQMASKTGDAATSVATEQLSALTGELYGAVMKTRLQAIAHAWAKYPRMVRDLMVTCGKKVRLEMDGEDTELDRAVIEAIRDPLTHLVRNAVDHGLEAPAERETLGKPPEGRLQLRAFQEAGEVAVSIADDGHGIDPMRVKARAVERKIIAKEEADRMSDGDAVNLIFMPGFSTATTVTQVSGRGVGMDVVKNNVERLGGKVIVETKIGHGTTITLRIPLTLAVIPALLVETSKQLFAIPMAYVQELCIVDATRGQVVEDVHGTPVYRLRGELLTLLYLNEHLSLPARPNAVPQIVVLSWRGRSFGLAVDDILDVEDTVVKGVGNEISDSGLFNGATILGDGHIVPILALSGMVKRAALTAHRPLMTSAPAPAPTRQGASKKYMALLATPEGGQMAVYVDNVSRFELFPQGALERAGERYVVQYNGRILPVVRVSDVLLERRQEARVPAPPAQSHLHLLITTGNRVGLYMGELLDVVERGADALQESSRAGVLGTLVLQQRVTEVVDVPTVLQMAGMGDGCTVPGERTA